MNDADDLNEKLNIIQSVEERGIGIRGNANNSLFNTGDNPTFNIGEQISLIEYAAWHDVQNRWMLDGFLSDSESRAHFGQVLNISDPTVQLIERHTVWHQFDEWYASWEITQQPLVVLGEEGDGKTWAVAAWLNRLLSSNATLPAVLLLGSGQVGSDDPFRLIESVIEQRFRCSSDVASRSLVDWLKDKNQPQPLAICILDGLNEHHEPSWWRTLISAFESRQWKNQVMLIITARQNYWNNNLRHLVGYKVNLPPYNDEEFALALRKYHLQSRDIPKELQKLARKPRYLDLLIKHRERMVQSGDFTVARLIYEDWKDRFNRKLEFPINDFYFQNILRECAEKHRYGIEKIKPHDIKSFLPYEDKRAIDELCSSGVFEENHGSYSVKELHLTLGLAFLLVEEIDEAILKGKDGAEAIASWLEPHIAIDLKAKICEMAALIALETPSLSIEAKVELLFMWITHQNIEPDTQHNLAAYFPLSPPSYFGLAERIWDARHRFSWVEKVLLHTFLGAIVKDQEAGKLSHWQSICERWLGFVHRFNYLYLDTQTEEQDQKTHQKIIDRLGMEALPPGPFIFAEYPFTAVDNEGLLRMALVALSLISHIPRTPFIHALALGCVAEAIVDFPRNYKKFDWVIRTSEQPLLDAIQPEIHNLLDTNHQVTMQAASRLLTFVGSHEAMQVQATLPDDLSPPNPAYEEYKKDPCTGFFSWRREDCEQCMRRTDIDPSRIARELDEYCIDPDLPYVADLAARLAPLAETLDVSEMRIVLGQTRSDHDFESYEPALCVYAPEALAQVIHRLATEIPTRTEMALRQAVYELQKHALILTSAEHQHLFEAWLTVRDVEYTDNDVRVATEWWLFELLLSRLDPNEQLTYLLSRPSANLDVSDFDDLFQPPTDWLAVWQLLAEFRDAISVRRLLWFVGTHPHRIPTPDIAPNLIPLLEYDDSFLRSLVLGIIYHTKEPGAIAQVIAGGWQWNAQLHIQENKIGSLIFAEHGQHLPFTEILRRVHPQQLGHAVECRGSQPDEVHIYGEMLHDQWRRLVGDDVPDVPDFSTITITLPAQIDRSQLARWRVDKHPTPTSMREYVSNSTDTQISPAALQDLFDTEKQELQWQEQALQARSLVEAQRAAENDWFDQLFYADDLVALYARCPELVHTWAENALSDTSAAQRRLRVAGSFYDALCTLLLKHNPALGIKLYWRIFNTPMHTMLHDGRTKVWALDYELFKTPRTLIIEEAWQRRLDVCTTDADIMDVIIAV